MNPGDYDPFNFMIVLLFIYAILIGFIMILIYNNTRAKRSELVSALLSSRSGDNCNGTENNGKNKNCIPSPTPIKGQRV
jgi:hypothetical protein